jgi:hypothetical protein
MGHTFLNCEIFSILKIHGGEGGIRTRDTGLPYTRFPGVLLRPLGHLSKVKSHYQKAREITLRALNLQPQAVLRSMRLPVVLLVCYPMAWNAGLVNAPALVGHSWMTILNRMH